MEPRLDYGQEQYAKIKEQREEALLLKLAKKHDMLLLPVG